MTTQTVYAKVTAGKSSGISARSALAAMSARWVQCSEANAELTVVGVPDDVAVPSVLRHLNDTCIAQPWGARNTVHYDELGRGRWLNLYRRAAA